MKLNYRCVPSQKCDFSDDLSGPRDGVGTFLKTENLFDQLGLADYAECPDLENGVCCHDEYVIPDNDCSSYVNEGLWQYRLRRFHERDTKLERILAKN